MMASLSSLAKSNGSSGTWQRSNFLDCPTKGILAVLWVDAAKREKKPTKHVLFADQVLDKEIPLDSICLFDKDDETLACNPYFNGQRVTISVAGTPKSSMKDRKYVNGGPELTSIMKKTEEKEKHADLKNVCAETLADGAGVVCGTRTPSTIELDFLSNINLSGKDSNRGLQTLAENLNKINTSLVYARATHHEFQQLALVSIKHDHDRRNVTCEHGHRKDAHHASMRKICTLWLTFTLRTETENENWGMVALTAVSFNSKSSQLSAKIRVKNVAFHKVVFARFTVDNWRTYRDIYATYESSDALCEYDDFAVVIPVPINITHGRKLAFSICYQAMGVEYWDNNTGENYEGRVVFGVPSPTTSRKCKPECVQSLEDTMYDSYRERTGAPNISSTNNNPFNWPTNHSLSLFSH